jgi:hypothetical protein
MRTLQNLYLSSAVGVFQLFCAAPGPAQAPHEPTDLERRLGRHFPEGPPVLLEFVEGAEHSPLLIVTNSYQFPLTAYPVQIGPKSANDRSQTLIFDALTRVGLLTAIPRGLSHKIGVPHIVGGPVPDAKLVAAVWEDGNTFGPDELLSRVTNSRRALADSYDRAIASLQTGLDKNWTAEEYVIAAQQLKPPMPPQMATVEEVQDASESLKPQTMPSHTITDNMQHAVQHDGSSARAAKVAQTLLKNFEQSRDALRQALREPSPSSDKP